VSFGNEREKKKWVGEGFRVIEGSSGEGGKKVWKHDISYALGKRTDHPWRKRPLGGRGL